MERLRQTFTKKAKEFDHIVKSGRTHLQDAVPVRLGQEFRAYASIMDLHITRYKRVMEDFKELGIGGTAVGTGLNAHPKARFLIIKELSKTLKMEFEGRRRSLAAMQKACLLLWRCRERCETWRLDLVKICGDLRFLTSGPKTGIREIALPPIAPGSSIMPGKVNPAMPEMLMMVCYQVAGNDQAIAFASQAGQLELNVMMPLIALNIMTSLTILENAIHALSPPAA